MENERKVALTLYFIVAKRKAISRFRLFLLVPVLCWGWGVADRVAQLANGGIPYVWLQMLHGICTAAQVLREREFIMHW